MIRNREPAEAVCETTRWPYAKSVGRHFHWMEASPMQCSRRAASRWHRDRVELFL
jgi:hypothetical protein